MNLIEEKREYLSLRIGPKNCGFGWSISHLVLDLRFFVLVLSMLLNTSCTTISGPGGTFPSAAPLPADVWINGITFTNPGTGWVSALNPRGDTTSIYKSIDSGLTWSPVLRNLSGLHAKVFFIDQLHGWVNLNNGLILRTLNGGLSWVAHQLPDSPNTILDIYFSDPNRGWTTTFNGDVFTTGDGGVNWHLISEFHGPLFGTVFSRGSRTWLGGGALAYLDTPRNEITFIAEFGGYTIRKISFFDSEEGVLGGVEGVFITHDSGKTWVRSATFNALDVAISGDSTIWVAGSPALYQSRIYQSTDRGLTWTSSWESQGDSLILVSRLTFISPDLGWASAGVYNDAGDLVYPVILRYQNNEWLIL